MHRGVEVIKTWQLPSCQSEATQLKGWTLSDTGQPACWQKQLVTTEWGLFMKSVDKILENWEKILSQKPECHGIGFLGTLVVINKNLLKCFHYSRVVDVISDLVKSFCQLFYFSWDSFKITWHLSQFFISALNNWTLILDIFLTRETLSWLL